MRILAAIVSACLGLALLGVPSGFAEDEAFRFVVTGDSRGSDGGVNSSILAEQAEAIVSEGADFVLHQAALGSVPRSIENPVASHEYNVTGTLDMLEAARDMKLKRMVYASSCSVYGVLPDLPDLPRAEEVTGACLSPYAATKVMTELYASVLSPTYGLSSVGLR